MSVADPESPAAPDAAPTGAVARIQSVEIENLRGIKSGKLEGLAPLTILTGPNGSGKSTVLDALDIGGSPNPAEAVQDCVNRRPPISGAARWLLWRGHGGGERCRVQCVATAGEARGCTLTVTEDRAAATWEITVTAALHAETVRTYQRTFRHNGMSIERQHPEVDVALPGVDEVEVVEGVPRTFRNTLSDLYSAIARAGRRENIAVLASSLVSTVDRVEVLTEGDVPVLHFGWAGGSLPIAYYGEGTHAAFRIGLSLTALSGGVALLEEPEAHLHPAAMALVAKAIVNAVRSGTQVVLTTHSLEFIDCLLDECEEPDGLLALFTLWLDDGHLQSVRHDGGEVRFARRQIAEDLR
ncbi:AAA family ATPase [Alienimonas chondri]|uniref:Uncharacterized protein n=1 Tax=Alienimonas chondri TaxID=2681879 RepID=A0ABX1VHK5_9PLAN|nr:ATP-binding protein [Alienimonas chondri]NNJ27624.1 hypothetical protein [Alienimonas chondri]